MLKYLQNAVITDMSRRTTCAARRQVFLYCTHHLILLPRMSYRTTRVDKQEHTAADLDPQPTLIFTFTLAADLGVAMQLLPVQRYHKTL